MSNKRKDAPKEEEEEPEAMFKDVDGTFSDESHPLKKRKMDNESIEGSGVSEGEVMQKSKNHCIIYSNWDQAILISQEKSYV